MATQMLSSPLSPNFMDDLEQGINEFRSIQGVVRLTFKAFHDVLTAQAEAIKSLERELHLKASSAEVAEQLVRKADAQDVNERLDQVYTLMESKAGSAELERVALLSDLDAAVGGLGAEVAARVEALSRRVDEAAAEAATAARVEAVAERAEAQAAELRRAVADVAAGLDRKADLAAVDAKLGGKADRAEVEARLEALLPAAVAQAALAVKAGACQLEAAREELRHELAQRAAALEEQMAAAADASSVEALADQVAMLSARARRDADAAQSTFAALSLNYDTALTAVRLREDKLLRDVEGLHDGVRLLQASVAAQERRVREGMSEHARRGGELVASLAAEVDRKLGTKADVDEVNDALAELCADVDAVGALQAEGRVARWGWSGGRLAAGNAVPWTTQQYNGLSEALSWQPGDATTVVVAEPGLYEICLGFFTSKRPHVQVLVNGVPALSAFHKGSTVVHEPRVTCLSCVELLQLPHPNSALVVTLSGGGGGGGAGIADVSTTTAATVVATGTARRRATSASGDGGAPTKLPSGRGGGSSRLLLLQGFFSLRKLQP